MKFIKKLLFPLGKKHKNYNQFIGWSFISNILVSAQSVIATHSMLHSINTDSEMSRTINYVGKDIIGQIGGLFYLANIGKKIDQKPEKFLLYSNIIQQSSFISITMTPLAPEYFLPIAGMSNILTNISYTSYGAINAKCIQKLSLDDNVGEIYAKISIVNTIGSSIGLLLGLYITVKLPDYNNRLAILPLLGIFRVYTYQKAIKNLI
jgi:hypothetical protein